LSTLSGLNVFFVIVPMAQIYL